MTAQISDTYWYNNQKYLFVKKNAPLTFDPRKFDLKPHSISSGCWRGYWCEYRITNNKLFLENLYINFDEYTDIHLFQPYTGILLLGKDFLSKYYIHMGFQQPYAYETLTEFIFKEGYLLNIIDRSVIAKQLRTKIDLDHQPKWMYPIVKLRKRLIDFTIDKNNIWWL